MPTSLEEMTQRLMAYKTGEMVSLMAHLGIRMGLYEAMTGKHSVSVDDLASATGLPPALGARVAAPADLGRGHRVHR